jgi:hypothetical protein
MSFILFLNIVFTYFHELDSLWVKHSFLSGGSMSLAYNESITILKGEKENAASLDRGTTSGGAGQTAA